MKIKAIITGSTGMVGKGVLLECMDSPFVESILVINRHPVGISDPKIKEIIHPDFFDFSSIREELKGYNACFFCLGISSIGLNEDKYHHITYDIAIALAKVLKEENPQLVFCYVSGEGTDSTEKGRTMWARVKGKTENAILGLGFRDAYAFRPGLILPEKGIRSRTGWYNAGYIVLRPFFPLLRRSKSVTTTSRIGQAMIAVARHGYPGKRLVNADINQLAAAASRQAGKED